MREFVAAPARVPWYVTGAALAAAALLYVLAFDQGQVLALVQGDYAYQMNLIHELVHDARHAAGFPCH